ncbi:Cyclohexadienyl dehydrogenase |uniref:Cyclohexadienyl dehydrogenase \
MIITDVGSTKGSVIDMAKKVFGKWPENFIPAHPIAGKEKNSVRASDALLFKNKRVILTPSPNAVNKSIEIVQDMWQQTGALLEVMDYQQHDKLLALTSHLPHILAYALIDDLIENTPNAFDYTAGGFKDFSRIASSDSIMWRDICLNNSAEIVIQIKQYQQSLNKLLDFIKNKNSEKLEKTFNRAKQQRDNHFNN